MNSAAHRTAMATELEELLGFLSSPSPQVSDGVHRRCALARWPPAGMNLRLRFFPLALQLRKAAVDIVSGLTGSEEGLRSLAAQANLALPPLLRLLDEVVAVEGVSRAAAEALVNLSQDAAICEKLVSHGAVGNSVGVLYKQPHGGGDGISRLLVMLLVNLTQVDSGVNALLQAST